MTYIPYTNEDKEFTGAVLEVLASTAYNTVVPAYFDVVMSLQSLNGQNETLRNYQEKILNIIRETCSYYDCTLTKFSIQLVFNNSFAAKQNRFYSTYQGLKTVIDDEIEVLQYTYFQ